MTKLLYGVLLGFSLTPLNAAQSDSESPQPAPPTDRPVDAESVTTTGGTVSTAAAVHESWIEELATPHQVRAWLQRLVTDHSDRLACIIQASLDGDRGRLQDLEAGGFIGGKSSTVMVHDGHDHLIGSTSGRPQRIPHIHVWPPPPGALAWVHTHHPSRGFDPSANDIAAAARMQQDHSISLPFIVLTPIRVTAYWHGRTVGGVTIAGEGWWDGRSRADCAPAYGQP